jgi:hypothetical protein
VVLALGQRVAGGGWLALHLVLLGAATNAIVVWSEYFAAALLRAPPVSERVALVRALALNLGIVGVLGGVHAGRSGLAAAGACLAGLVVLGHALGLAGRIARALPARLSGTVWFYVAAAAALLAGMGLGLWLAGGAAGSADGHRALRLAHVHLNVLGWVPPGEERLPAALQVAAGRGARHPDGVAVGDPEGQEHGRGGVAHQGGVEVAQPPAAGVDGQGDDHGGHRPGDGRHPATGGRAVHVE